MPSAPDNRALAINRQTSSILKLSSGAINNALASPQASKVGFMGSPQSSEADLNLIRSEPQRKQSALEKYNIDEKDTPWYNIKEQGVDFEDYREKIKDQYEKEKEDAAKERNRLGDLIKEKDELEKELEQNGHDITEEQKDRQLFDDYLKKGLVNIKNLVLKNPLHRTDKENEFLILYMRH